MFPLLPNDLLLDAYQNALRMQLDQEFIVMLRMEIRRRRLSIPVRRVF
ncbi:MAG: sporulation histidine kinase inhibitor Sda [Candidatus Cohnella colombiensis]|uniref:Sporulation histidine kinase inhibitor Sda n=1 Tax=Candidatus Cohnella colombiensis TaxID=3121368 RepID=A0AA95EUP9_9BACL|nr:MAG: sporulation histidine kinase inhibitor Sda [Cohnella sp.]